MSARMLAKAGLVLAGLLVSIITPMAPFAVLAAPAAKSSAPAISEDIRSDLAQMAKTLLSDQYSFKARTLRVYVDPSGQPLHIAHTLEVVVRRPDHLAISITGDDGSTKLLYDGKTVTLFGVDTKKYATVPVPDTIEGMVHTVMGKLGVDFPLADFLTDAPDKAFLSGVTSVREINTVTIDGVPCRHLLFKQPPGIDLELWIEKNEKALPRRLIVTYRSEPGQPSFIAEMYDWNFSVHPSDADFTFQPPEGATKFELKQASKGAAPAKTKGAHP
jgi:hypothetical protein